MGTNDIILDLDSGALHEAVIRSFKKFLAEWSVKIFMLCSSGPRCLHFDLKNK
jgi:protein tyrosine phosphatase (PTP) superfamily phosphohydrolase (DUF442 family)